MRYEVGRFGAFLATRESAAKVRNELEREIRKQPAGATATVSFAGVDAVTVSFADELVGRLIAARTSGDLRDVGVVLYQVNEEVEEAVALSLERRGLVVAVDRGAALELLPIEDYLAATYRQACRLVLFRAGELAESMGITPQNANNRLKRLVAAGTLLLTRGAPQGGGKEYTYSLPDPRS